MIIRRIKESDFKLIEEQETLLFPQAMGTLIYEKALKQDLYDAYVAEEDETLVGAVIIWLDDPYAQIINIYSMPEVRSSGVGTRLMEKALEVIDQTNSVTTLEVRVSNTHAIKLYEKFGFEIEQTKKNYYSDHENAYYMVRK